MLLTIIKLPFSIRTFVLSILKWPPKIGFTVSEKNIQSNLSYPNVNYPKLLGYSKTMDSPDFALLSIAIKLPIIRISIIRKIRFFEVISRSRLKKMLLNYPSRFEVQMSCMVIMISLFGRVQITHLSDLEKKVETGN